MITTGNVFVHDRFINPVWVGSIRSAPKALMRVTRVTRRNVWYRYADDSENRGTAWVMDRAEFERRFSDRFVS